MPDTCCVVSWRIKTCPVLCGGKNVFEHSDLIWYDTINMILISYRTKTNCEPQLQRNRSDGKASRGHVSSPWSAPPSVNSSFFLAGHHNRPEGQGATICFAEAGHPHRLRILLCIMCCMLYALYSIPYAVYRRLYSVLYTVYSILYIPYSVLCNSITRYSILHTPYPMLCCGGE